MGYVNVVMFLGILFVVEFGFVKFGILYGKGGV